MLKKIFKNVSTLYVSLCHWQALSEFFKIITQKQHVKFRSSRPKVFSKKGVLRNFTKFTGKHLCQGLFFNKVAGLRPSKLLKKETLIQVFSCEFCEISKSTFFHRTPMVAAFVSFNNENILIDKK